MSEFDKKISALTGGSASQAGDEYVVARSGSNFKITGANVAAAATAVGTIATGTWQGTPIANAYIATGLDATKLTVGATLPSNVLASSLTSVGTLSALTVTGAATAGKLVPTANTVTGNGMYLPTTNTLAFSTNGVEAARIDASGNVGIGVTPTSRNNTHLQIVDGIGFPATQVASSDANTLDDYEEGTFTPSLAFGGASTGVTYGGGRIGYYTKVGNIVYYSIAVALTNKGSSTGSATVTGLPFTASASASLFPDGEFRAVNAVTVTAPAYATINNNSSILLLLDNNAGSQQAVTDADFTNNSEFGATGFYYV